MFKKLFYSAGFVFLVMLSIILINIFNSEPTVNQNIIYVTDYLSYSEIEEVNTSKEDLEDSAIIVNQPSDNVFLDGIEDDIQVTISQVDIIVEQNISSNSNENRQVSDFNNINVSTIRNDHPDESDNLNPPAEIPVNNSNNEAMQEIEQTQDSSSSSSQINYSLPTKDEGCYRSSSDYIKTIQASDSSGKLMQSIEVVRLGVPSKTITTYVHRCIHHLAVAIIDDFNETQTDPKYKLGFFGWRSHSSQITARKKNGCPDIYESSASSCKIPTAIPGTSNHQDGLALDFYCSQGVVKEGNCNNALDWLRCHGADYGLLELSSETWHWDYYTQRKNGFNRLTRKC